MAKARDVEVDFAAVWDALDEKRREQERSWVSLCDELQCKDVQVAAMKWQGRGVSAHLLLAMMIYLARDLREFRK
jgi:hypothetical protein